MPPAWSCGFGCGYHIHRASARPLVPPGRKRSPTSPVSIRRLAPGASPGDLARHRRQARYGQQVSPSFTRAQLPMEPTQDELAAISDPLEFMLGQESRKASRTPSRQPWKIQHSSGTSATSRRTCGLPRLRIQNHSHTATRRRSRRPGAPPSGARPPCFHAHVRSQGAGLPDTKTNLSLGPCEPIARGPQVGPRPGLRLVQEPPTGGAAEHRPFNRP